MEWMGGRAGRLVSACMGGWVDSWIECVDKWIDVGKQWNNVRSAD